MRKRKSDRRARGRQPDARGKEARRDCLEERRCGPQVRLEDGASFPARVFVWRPSALDTAVLALHSRPCSTQPPLLYTAVLALHSRPCSIQPPLLGHPHRQSSWLCQSLRFQRRSLALLACAAIGPDTALGCPLRRSFRRRVPPHQGLRLGRVLHEVPGGHATEPMCRQAVRCRSRASVPSALFFNAAPHLLFEITQATGRDVRTSVYAGRRVHNMAAVSRRGLRLRGCQPCRCSLTSCPPP